MMTRTLGLVSVFALLGSPAVAQQLQTGSPAAYAPILQALSDAEQQPPNPVEAFVPGQASGELVATDLIGRPLHDLSGTEIGTIVDVSVDDERRLSLVVLDVGTYLGTEKKVAFDVDALAYRSTGEEVFLVADIARDDLEQAPAFTSLAEAAELHDMQEEAADQDQPVPVEDAQGSN